MLSTLANRYSGQLHVVDLGCGEDCIYNAMYVPGMYQTVEPCNDMLAYADTMCYRRIQSAKLAINLDRMPQFQFILQLLFASLYD